MSTPLNSAAYPAAFLDALAQAGEKGSLSIPCPKPAALRLRFYGLVGALRKEGKPEIVENLGFYIRENPLRLDIVRKSLDDEAALVAAALGSSPSASDPAAEALKRILGEKPHVLPPR